MGKVSDYVLSLIGKQVDDHGIVVWYDPQKAYSSFIRGLTLPETTILTYKDGFFHLREELEPLLECVTGDGEIDAEREHPPKVIIYIPVERDQTDYALIETETAGIVLEPGAAEADHNTRLGRIVETVFSEVQPAKAGHLARQADEGLLTLEELDRMAEEAGTLTTRALQVIFGQVSPAEVLLLFASDESLDVKIDEKRALGELINLVRNEVGLEAKGIELPSELRRTFRRYLLLGELAMAYPEGQLPGALTGITLPGKPVQQDSLRHLCQVWRNRVDLKDAYAEAARTLQAEAELKDIILTPDPLRDVETFAYLDDFLLRHTQEMVLGGDVAGAIALAEKRRSLFWSREIPEIQLRWRLVETAATLIRLTESIRQALKKGKWSLEELIDAYVKHSEPWMLIDRLARHLESRYIRVEMSGTADEEVLHSLMVRCREAYVDTLRNMAEFYSNLLVNSAFRAGNAKAQETIFVDWVKPLLDKGEKTAYLLVDALRYEMASELLEGFAGYFDSEIIPVLGQLPGITSLGMASLLPGAEKGLSIEGGPSGITVSVEGRPMKDRTTRLTWISERAGVPAHTLKLSDIVRLTPKRKKDLSEAKLVVVTSQEIDRLGEEGADEGEARVYMDEVLEKLRRGIRNLASIGFNHFVVTADHGFLFTEGLERGLQMDPPGGKTVELHPRFWIGQGGNNGEGYFRVNASDLELGGALEFAFPKGLGTFKVKGGTGSYYHGGPSLQESLLPLCHLKARPTVVSRDKAFKIKMNLAKPKISNRFFSVVLSLEAQGLLPTGQKRVRLEIFSGKTEVGVVAMATYGFEEGTREFIVESGQPNAVTVMLNPKGPLKSLTIRVVDCETQLVLETISDIPVDLAI